MRRGLLANLARERLRLVGHQLHRAHDAAAFGVDAVVMTADDGQQPGIIDLSASAARLGELALQQPIVLIGRKRRHAAKCVGDLA